MVEEIITALSRIHWLFVIARNSTFTYKGRAIDVKQVGRDLGVRYVLEGSVRKGGNRVRITGQLIDTMSGAHLWADRFDGLIEDVFELQDKVASSVAGVIEPTLQAAETARSAGRATSDLTAYDLYLRAYAMFFSSHIPEALHTFEQAIERDPRYGPALAWAATCYQRLVAEGRSKDPAADSRKGMDLARAALRVAGDDPSILANAAGALAYFGEDIGTMMALVDRALTLNPSFARGWFTSSRLRCWAGKLDAAIQHAETSLRLSPRVRIGPSLAVIGYAHFLSRRFDEAVPKLRLAIQEDPSAPNSYRFLAACYARLGAARRGARDRHAATGDHPCGDTEHHLAAERAPPRTFPLGPAPCGGRDRMTQTRRLMPFLRLMLLRKSKIECTSPRANRRRNRCKSIGLTRPPLQLVGWDAMGHSPPPGSPSLGARRQRYSREDLS
jgi:tetratricopeptide (TPR) repeat protein